MGTLHHYHRTTTSGQPYNLDEPALTVEMLALPANLDLLFDGPKRAATTIVLAHGAGAGRDTPFLELFAKELGKRGYRVVRFEFR